ncbi:MAG TPA: hypothetical protein VFT29_08885 [Gemmatimonadaceae bacterium]|nr:hypothetical protein [Gemmatimonadaceae bacterium]
MNLLFWRRSRLRAFADGIQPELRAVATPEPTDELLHRILMSRQAGTRVILPLRVDERGRPWRRVSAAIAMAVVLLLVVLPARRRVRDIGEDATSPSSFLGQMAFAQPADGAPRLPGVRLERASAIRPMRLEYTRRVRDTSGRARELVISLTVEAGNADVDGEGTPTWRIISQDRHVVAGQERLKHETLYVAQADLRLLRRAIHVSPYRRFQRINIGQRFQDDSITGRMTTDGPSIGAGRGIARQLRPELTPYLSDAFAPVFLMAASLSPSWKGSATLVGWAVIPRDVYVPLEMRVVGEDRIRVPAGEFDCWRIAIRLWGRQVDYWARKSDGLGIRVYDESDKATAGTRETVLRSVR